MLSDWSVNHMFVWMEKNEAAVSSVSLRVNVAAPERAAASCLLLMLLMWRFAVMTVQALQKSEWSVNRSACMEHEDFITVVALNMVIFITLQRVIYLFKSDCNLETVCILLHFIYNVLFLVLSSSYCQHFKHMWNGCSYVYVMFLVRFSKIIVVWAKKSS